jgi:hypothetical protein
MLRTVWTFTKATDGWHFDQLPELLLTKTFRTASRPVTSDTNYGGST